MNADEKHLHALPDLLDQIRAALKAAGWPQEGILGPDGVRHYPQDFFSEWQEALQDDAKKAGR